MGDLQHPYLTIRSLSGDRDSVASKDSAYVSGSGATSGSASASASAHGVFAVPTATHDIGRVNYHVRHLDSFVQTLEDSASRAFPNRGRTQQRYAKVIALLLHWKSDDLFVLPELEDLERCMREDYGFQTDTFPIPSENAHLELMLRVGAMIKDHEATDTLFIVYYGGHARIDESRQSTWCATRNINSPWLQWSAIQTLLERSVSDTLILLDCCAGAASATFPNGKSITETISASSWDAIAPDPGRYSFTSTLIEVLQEWRLRTFSAAMLHAEVLARLKHPRPITINGKLFEARSTPVHFMMTSNHKAPSIEIGRILPRNRQLPSPPAEPVHDPYGVTLPSPSGRGPLGEPVSDPNEDTPHVMISLALEEDQTLDLSAWEQWLASFPALAKYVKVQGVFKSHSTLLLLSVPVMVWDLLPENHACSFVAFIRSNNLIKESVPAAPEAVTSTQHVSVHGSGETRSLSGDVSRNSVDVEDAVSGYIESDPDDDDEEDIGNDDIVSVISGTTFAPTEGQVPSMRMSIASTAVTSINEAGAQRLPMPPVVQRQMTMSGPRPCFYNRLADAATSPTKSFPLRPHDNIDLVSPGSAPPGVRCYPGQNNITESVSAGQMKMARRFTSNMPPSRTMIADHQAIVRRADLEDDTADGPRLAPHVVDRLEEYFQQHPNPSVGIAEFFASNLGVEKRDIDLWFHRRRQHEMTKQNLQNLKMIDHPSLEYGGGGGANMILPGQLNRLLDIFPPNNLFFVDLRSPTDFDKSHIHGAVNLRVPVSFVEESFDLIDRAFTDDQSRRTFARASSYRCIIFYDRVLEFSWECPMADALIGKLREKKGWTGDYYVLKGHYREFSTSFDKYITGDRMSQAGKDYVDGLRERPPPTEMEEESIKYYYKEWRDLVDDENRIPASDTVGVLEDRRQAVIQHQVELAAELERRNPALYCKAMGMRPGRLPRSFTSPPAFNTSFDKELRMDLVGPLSRGLEKLQGEPTTQQTTQQTTQGYYDKLADLGESSSVSASEDFDDIDPRDEQLRNDPAFLKAGDISGLGGMGLGRGGANTIDVHRGREKSFWKRLRANK